MNTSRGFASDNNSGIHPRVLDALRAANVGHAVGYGDDPWTARLAELIKSEFGEDVAMFPVFNGTGANVLALASLLEPHECVLASDSSHICTDETGAPERITGCKIVAVSSADGKLTPDLCAPYLRVRGSRHASQPRIVSVTQCTEFGLVYTHEELLALSRWCREHGLLLHMDGARLSNAAAALQITLREASKDLGVDALSLGGTKNGLLGAEAVLFFCESGVTRAKYLQKQCLQLSSKMRFISAQLAALLEGGLWRMNALHANAMAQLLSEKLGEIEGVMITRPTQANLVFLRVPPDCIRPLQARSVFYVTDSVASEIRLVTSFDTTEDDVLRFVAMVREVIEQCGEVPLAG
jgi:threonine aldolase